MRAAYAPCPLTSLGLLAPERTTISPTSSRMKSARLEVEMGDRIVVLADQ